MLIDFHTHCFPHKIAARAMESLSNESALVPPLNGTLEELQRGMDEGNVKLSVVLGIATNPHQQAAVNNYAAELNNNPNLVAFGSVHPQSEDVMDELERIKDMGLKGVKLHPEYQNFFVDDEKMKPIYKKISALGLITVFHAGADYGFAAPYKCMPERMARAVKWFDSPVVAAHWGGLMCHEQVLEHLCGLPVYFDTSFSYGATSLPMLNRICEKHGTDFILFGSDSPWHKPSDDIHVINHLNLSDREREKIFWENAVKLLDIK